MKIIITKATESPNLKEKGFRERKKTDVIYVWLEDETIRENLMNRRERPSKAYKEFVLPLGLKELGYTEEEAKAIIKKAYWSQKAGCNCGCSPGFLTKGMKEGEAHITFAGVNEEEIKDAKELVD